MFELRTQLYMAVRKLSLAEELLNAITYVASQKPPFKIETDGYMIYWAGTILRIDIKQKELE